MKIALFKYGLILFLAFSLKPSQAQPAAEDTSIHKVMMVPFGRFNFFTQFPSPMIDNINKIESTEAYDLFKKALLGNLDRQEQSKWGYSIMPAELADTLQRFYTLKNRKKPVNHFGLRIYQGFYRLAENMMVSQKVDGILFFTYYKIEKSHVIYSPENSRPKRTVYASHYTEAVLVTRYGHYYASGKIRIEDAPKNKVNIEAKNLLISSLASSYVILGENLPQLLRRNKK